MSILVGAFRWCILSLVHLRKRAAVFDFRIRLAGRIGGRFAGDQAGAAAEREIFESPLNENDHAALKLDDVDEVDEEPHQPSEQTGNVDTRNICYRGRAADHGHVSFIEIMK